MSRITNPDTEYYVTCGFFNSDSAGTRKYHATDFSQLFDGMVTDGVFASIGDCLVVKAGSGTTVNVGTGKCWFNHTWTLNEDILPITCDVSETVLNRIDAIVLEVNTTQSIRDNCFKYVKGTPATEPKKPTLTNTDLIHQHALCYITRPAGSASITQANIENVVGTEETPFITAILQTVSLDKLLGQWRTQLDEFVATETADLEDYMSKKESEIDTVIAREVKEFDDARTAKESEFDSALANKLSEYNSWSSELRGYMEDLVSEVDLWYSNMGTTIHSYLQNMKDTLGTDPATNLQMQIDESEIRNILTNGFVDGDKTISADGSVITSTDSEGRALVKTFTNEFLTSTTVLKDVNGTELGRLVKSISSDGLTITSEITLL